MRKVLAALAASFALTSAASAVEFNHIEGYPTAVQMHGDVEAGDGAKFQQVLDYRASKGLWTEWLTVNSYGGNTYAGWELAELVRTNSIKVVVNGGSHCLSACFKIFAAAHAGRFFHPEASLGVHSATTSDEYGNDLGGNTEGAVRATLATAKYLTALGTPASIIAKLISTEPEDMAFLKADELTQSGWATYYDDNGIDQQTATASSFGMSCEGEKGIYAVNWSGGGYIQVRDLWYAVTKSHVAKTNAWVATGQTKYGTYAAVFGGPNPRMEFSNGKEVVKDRCW